VDDACVSTFNDLKLKHDKKYIIFAMNEKMTEIKVKATDALVVRDVTFALSGSEGEHQNRHL